MIAAVFDCVMYVQAAINDAGPAAACLALAEDGQVNEFRKAHPALMIIDPVSFLRHVRAETAKEVGNA
jgi:hypothetical protein